MKDDQNNDCDGSCSKERAEQIEMNTAEPNRIVIEDTSRSVPRSRMNGKPVFSVPAKSIINFSSGFGKKLLCDGLTFTAGTACAFDCTYCYVGPLMRKSPHLKGIKQKHEEVVIRREGALNAIRAQLTDRRGNPKFKNPTDTRVIYGSPLVDVGANLELARETIDLCKVILEFTHWQIRLLSKSTFLPFIANGLEGFPELHARERVIYGVSTGTLDNKLARAIELSCPFVSRRIESLYRLQDSGFRTFGMICPSLPQQNYEEFAEKLLSSIRAERCEHIWAEVLNVRGESMTRTVDALTAAGFQAEALALQEVSTDKDAWEEYARATFEAHAAHCPSGKLRFLQYATSATSSWWEQRRQRGAVLL